MNTVNQQVTILKDQLAQVMRQIDEIQATHPDSWWDRTDHEELCEQGREISRDLQYYQYMDEESA